MKYHKLIMIVMWLGLFISCKNEKTTKAASESKQEQKSTEQEANIQEAPIINYQANGISESSIEKVKALELGSTAPDFSAKDQNGKEFKLSEEVKKGDVVIIFYRGYWCPICTKHLAGFVEKLKDYQDKGAQIIAVAPEGEGNRAKTVEDIGNEIPFISDPSAEIMKKYGVAFTVNESYNKKFSDWKGVTLREVNGQDEAMLPVPATYIIDQNQKVKWVHFDPNYRKRSSTEEVLNQL